MSDSPFSYAMLSDPGRVRQRNEDACAADPELGVFVVCDGVGGAAGGEIASQLAAKTLLARLREANASDQDGAKPDGAKPDGTEAATDREPGLRDAIACANHAVHSQSLSRAELYGMATTMVAMRFQPNSGEAGPGTVWLANVGDSRCYRLREGSIEQLTHDHSLVGEQVRNGLMTREEAEVSPVRNVITRAVGSDSEVEADVQHLSARPGDMFLLSSDGLTRELSDAAVAQVLSAVAGLPGGAKNDDLALACVELVHRANEKGGGDNITCVLVRIR